MNQQRTKGPSSSYLRASVLVRGKGGGIDSHTCLFVPRLSTAFCSAHSKSVAPPSGELLASFFPPLNVTPLFAQFPRETERNNEFS